MTFCSFFVIIYLEIENHAKEDAVLKLIKSKKLWISLLVFGAVFAVAAVAVFIMSLFGVRVFASASTAMFVWDLLFLISALVLSSVIIIVSIHLKP